MEILYCRVFLLVLILLHCIYSLLEKQQYTSFSIVLESVIIFMCVGITVVDIFKNEHLLCFMDVFALLCWVIALVLDIVDYKKFKKEDKIKNE